jgi:hypothetical protein
VKEPPATSKAVAAQESAEAAKSGEAESKAEEVPKSEDPGQPPETEKEKSENSPLDIRKRFWNKREQESAEAA